MRKYYIADCHFGDEEVIRFSHRPFSTVEEMDETMIARWNRTVKVSDEVYIIGDLIHRCLEPEKYLERLNGHLHLILGNHDRCIEENPSLHRYFEEITTYAVVYDHHHRLVLFHYPMLEWDGYYYGTWHLYGHIHNHPSLTQERTKELPKALNCGADVVGYCPRTFDELVAINKRDCYRSERPQGAV